MSLKIYSYPGNPRVWKALIAARYNGVEIETPEFDFKTVATADFKAKNPNGKVPVLETPNGCIFESNAIARYVARLRADTGLMGSTFFEAALVDQWCDWASLELDPPRSLWLYPIWGFAEFNGKAYAEAKKDIEKCLTVLNNHLLTHTYLVGNQITLADIVVITTVHGLVANVLDAKFLAPFGNFVRWFNTCVNQKEFADVMGKVEFCKSEKMAPKPKKETKPAAEKPAKEQKKPAEKPAAAPKPAPAAEEEAKPKKKNVLDELPESPMALDTVKKLFFAQKPYNPNFWNEFWPMFDAAGYSLWTYDYKYDAENTVYFMTGNLMAGFLQRLDQARKYAFGVIYMTGKDEDTAPFHVGGCFIFRGQDIPFEVIDAGDAEYYNWKKIEDTKNAEARKMFEERFCADVLEGQTVLDRRSFK